ncbi:hypothetical protein BG011_000851 [Mortierella polycephala]|uniref:DUF202 domain-containing protein n=1 Tax=Mortierella polycephala TaxID=41804 RepID=A0A9P6UAX9_9FUNG|nr:hypothetical protein BG011_000851 [Mortierella polycephala]
MNELEQHPLDVAAQSPLPKRPLSTTIPKGNVSFSDDSRNWSKENPVTQNQTPSSTTSELRNRQENRPTASTATSNINTCSTANTSSINNTTTGAESAGSPKQLSRRNTGPGGRLLPEEEEEEPEPLRWTSRLSSFIREIYDQCSPSLTLENKGSIARDHLANERTYLAWLRTSLSMITVGVAITQLFRLQSESGTPTKKLIKIAELGRPLGTSRYFHSQTVLSYGQFPASRGSVILATVTVLAVLLACFIIVILQGRAS